MRWLETFILVLCASLAAALFEWVHPEAWLSRQRQEDAESAKDSTVNYAERGKELVDNAWNHTAELVSNMSQRAKEKAKQYNPMSRPNLDPFRRVWESMINEYSAISSYVREYSDEYVMFFEVPGISRQHLEVRLLPTHILIHGSQAPCTEDRLCLEKQFDAKVLLPDGIDPEKMQCVLRDGMLVVRVPRIKENGKKITVHEGMGWTERAKEKGEAVLEKLGIVNQL